MTTNTSQNTAVETAANDNPPTTKTKAERKRESAKRLSGVLNEANEILKQLLVLEDGYPHEILTLWACHALAFKAATSNPPLVITADTYGAGKTEAASTVSLLVKNPVHMTNPTAPNIYRNTGKSAPGSKTMMIDEADQGVFDSKEMTAVVNAAWSREFAQVQRQTEKRTKGSTGYVTENFSLWQPFVFSMIGMPFKGSTRSRCIVVKMKSIDANSPEYETLLKGEARTKAKQRLKVLQGSLNGILAQHVDDLLVAEPEYPTEVASLRQRDNIRLMLAIADLAGDHWPETAREALGANSDTSLQVSELCEQALEAAIRWFDKEANEYRDRITAAEWISQGAFENLWGPEITTKSLSNIAAPLKSTRAKGRAGRRKGGRGYKRTDIELLLAQLERAGTCGKEVSK